MPIKKTAARKAAKRTAKKQDTPATRRWSAKVTTDSTHPDKGLFLKSPNTITRFSNKESVA
jgi:hypothetical protein